MSALFASGHIVDLIVLLMIVEGAVLVVHHRRSAGGIAPTHLLFNLLSGIGLLLALRAALVGAGWVWIGLALTVALVGHLADLRSRWR